MRANLDISALSPAFTQVGRDFAGPLFVRGSASSAKAYICIFTCASSRMTHLELTGDLSTNEFFQAFIRMISRRGLCSTVWSDNAKTFRSADRKIQQLCTQGSSVNKDLWDKIDQEELQAKLTSKGIKWKFIVERSPWHGGWWERLVRSVRKPLRKVLGKALLSYQELATVLTRIGAVINSRPLTTVSDGIRDLTPITLAYLALDRSLQTKAQRGRDTCISRSLLTISGNAGGESTYSSYPSDRSKRMNNQPSRLEM